MTSLWDSWHFVIWLAPVIWAFRGIIDNLLVDDVLPAPEAGVVTSGLFSILVPLGLLWLNRDDLSGFWPDPFYAFLAMIGGVSFMVFYYFIFITLFVHNDSSITEIFANMSILVVPFGALFFGERLETIQWAGILLIGAALVYLAGREVLKHYNTKVFVVLSAAIIFLSVSMLIQDHVYTQITYHQALFFFFIGMFVSGIAAGIYFRLKYKNKTPLTPIIKQYFLVFLFAESIDILCIIFSQRAILLSPSVSYVAAVESTIPIFVVLFSMGLHQIAKTFQVAQTTQSVLIIQYQQSYDKIIASILIGIGIYILLSN